MTMRMGSRPALDSMEESKAREAVDLATAARSLATTAVVIAALALVVAVVALIR